MGVFVNRTYEYEQAAMNKCFIINVNNYIIIIMFISFILKYATIKSSIFQL